MELNPDKTTTEITKEGAFGGSYFRDIYSGINGTWYRKSWKEFHQLKHIDANFYASVYYDKNLKKYKVKTRTFWENKGWINEINRYGWFQWYFRYWSGRRPKDDERQINRGKKL